MEVDDLHSQEPEIEMEVRICYIIDNIRNIFVHTENEIHHFHFLFIAKSSLCHLYDIDEKQSIAVNMVSCNNVNYKSVFVANKLQDYNLFSNCILSQLSPIILLYFKVPRCRPWKTFIRVNLACCLYVSSRLTAKKEKNQRTVWKAFLEMLG